MLVLWGKSQTGQFTRVRFLETGACNSPVFIRYWSKRWGFTEICRGGDKGVQEMKRGQGRGWWAPLSQGLWSGPQTLMWVSPHYCAPIVHASLFLFRTHRLWGGVNPKQVISVSWKIYFFEFKVLTKRSHDAGLGRPQTSWLTRFSFLSSLNPAQHFHMVPILQCFLTENDHAKASKLKEKPTFIKSGAGNNKKGGDRTKATTGVWKAQTDPWPEKTQVLYKAVFTLHVGMWVLYLCELQVVEPAPPEPNSGPEPLQPLSVYLLSTPVRVSTRVRTEGKNSNSAKTNKSEQTVLCHVTAFVFRLTRRTVLLQTSVAALFPLTGTIQGTGRDTGPACNRQMDARETEETHKHRRATLCHVQARCLSGFLMAKVTDVADEQPCDRDLTRRRTRASNVGDELARAGKFLFFGREEVLYHKKRHRLLS